MSLSQETAQCTNLKLESEIRIASSQKTISEEGNAIELYRGRWATTLTTGQIIAVGGRSFFSEHLDLMLTLDFNNFPNADLAKLPDKVNQYFRDSSEQIQRWLGNNQIQGLSAELYCKISATQKLVDHLLVVEDNNDALQERSRIYNQPNPKLSDLIAKSACAERALLGKHILDLVGLDCSYVSGVCCTDYHNSDLETQLSDHSFIVINVGQDQTIVFDIARKHSNGLPRLLNSIIPLRPQVFSNTQNLLVECQALFSHSKLFCGVGNPFLSEKSEVISSKTD